MPEIVAGDTNDATSPPAMTASLARTDLRIAPCDSLSFEVILEGNPKDLVTDKKTTTCQAQNALRGNKNVPKNPIGEKHRNSFGNLQRVTVLSGRHNNTHLSWFNSKKRVENEEKKKKEKKRRTERKERSKKEKKEQKEKKRSEESVEEIER
ncbi:hypothetical protein V1478_004168 [Vespula squamosa]|uniref:Uncharacterized protein n=1 Tax=Vespula squamosa TaxID=30214 RepID=A0ABD2BPG5_VESSQ